MSKQSSTIKQFSVPLLTWPQRCIYHCYYSFTEALPGLIGSSWSQNPLCRCSRYSWTCSFLLGSVSTGFHGLHEEPSFKVSWSWMPPARTWTQWQKKNLTWRSSHRCGKKLLRGTGCPPGRFNWAIVCILTGQYSWV